MENRAIILLALLALVVAFAQQPSAAVNPKVRLENFSLSSTPALPGQTIALALHYRSLEDVCAEKLAAQVSAAFPLSIRGPDTQYIDLLCQTNNDAAGTLYFKVSVDPLAQQGNYQLSLATTYQKSFLIYTDSNAINVQVRGKPRFDASVVSSTPIDMHPGDEGKLKIRVENAGSATVTSARATLYSPSGVEVKWASSSQHLGQMGARSGVDAEFAVEAPKNIPAGNYPLKLVVYYVELDGSNASQEFFFQLPVKARAELEARDAYGEAIQIGEIALKKIIIKNTGQGQALKVKVSIRPVYPFSTDGTIRYIEALHPGQEQVLEYSISADKEAREGKQLLSLVVNYQDDGGKKFIEIVDFTLSTRPRTLLEQVAAYWYILAIVPVAAIIIVARMRRKK